MFATAGFAVVSESDFLIFDNYIPSASFMSVVMLIFMRWQEDLIFSRHGRRGDGGEEHGV